MVLPLRPLSGLSVSFREQRDFRGTTKKAYAVTYLIQPGNYLSAKLSGSTTWEAPHVDDPVEAAKPRWRHAQLKCRGRTLSSPIDGFARERQAIPSELFVDLPQYIKIWPSDITGRCGDFGLAGPWGGNVISESAHALLHNMEPNMHHFYPIQTTTDQNDKRIPSKYFFAIIIGIPDFIDITRSDLVETAVRTNPEAKYWRFRDPMQPSICVRSKVVKRHHLWGGVSGGVLETELFCSDDFQRKWSDAGLQAFRFVKCLET